MNDQPAYHILGVSPTASEQEIKKAYRDIVRTAHPDVGGNAEDFLVVQRAYREMLERLESGEPVLAWIVPPVVNDKSDDVESEWSTENESVPSDVVIPRNVNKKPVAWHEWLRWPSTVPPVTTTGFTLVFIALLRFRHVFGEVIAMVVEPNDVWSLPEIPLWLALPLALICGVFIEKVLDWASLTEVRFLFLLATVILVMGHEGAILIVPLFLLVFWMWRSNEKKNVNNGRS